MAVNAATLDAAERTDIFVSLPAGGLMEMPYDRLTIDGTTYWDTTGPTGGIASNGVFPRGRAVGKEFITHRAMAFPQAGSGDVRLQAVWMLTGI